MSTLYGKTPMIKVYQHITKIIDFDTQLPELERIPFDWDAIVRVGSEALVLPTIYCRMSQKKALKLAPKDLNSYLSKVTRLNQERNLDLLKQVRTLSEWLKHEKIDHVFLKGSALLASNYYNEYSERMIGDIDLLINPSHLNQAYKLLLSKGYTRNVSRSHVGKLNIIEERHLPRMASDDYIAAVELHRNITDKPNNGISVPQLLEQKVFENDVAVPSKPHLMYHAILNNQLNSLGYALGTFSTRTLYDCLLLEEREQGLLKRISGANIFTKKFSTYASNFSEKFPKYNLFTLNNILFKKKLNSPLLFSIANYFNLIFMHGTPFVYSRAKVFFQRADYRKALFKQRKRVWNQMFNLPK